jgi:hypothetical protein
MGSDSVSQKPLVQAAIGADRDCTSLESPHSHSQPPHHTNEQRQRATSPSTTRRTHSLPYMLVPLVPAVYHYSPAHMPTSSSTTAVASTAGSRNLSPKRKHDGAMTNWPRGNTPPTLRLDVPEINASDAYYLSEGKCDSPRSRVAERLQALDIDRAEAEAEDAPRKRVKTVVEPEPDFPASKIPRLDVTPKQPPRPRFDLAQHQPGADLEIAETPGCRPEVTRSSAPSPLAKRSDPSMPNHISPIVRITPKRMRSPPPPLTTSPSPPTRTTNGPNLSPNSSQSSAGETDTTWQDSEITGHEIHAALGDDGEGINGIGFRPTPAIAQARSQKRKHQLSEWRAREAKEARQRRYEKRQGCGVDVEGGDGAQTRAVRFEEVG